jgi:hypothetical protein
MLMSAPAAAMSKTPELKTLATQGNAAVDVQTELNCSSHMLTAKITNKTTKEITPDVTFNEQKPNFDPLPIEAGKTGTVFYSYSGNQVLMNVEVAVDTYDPVMLNPTLNCDAEPVSFLVTETSDSAVVGMLTNNHSIVPRTVFTRVGLGDVRTETLQPGETRLIALPFASAPNQKFTSVTIATPEYESTYSVKLDQVLLPPLPPAPKPQS